ncbi:MAG TPA: fibronectin type III domain-containing protein, partial [Propionibacteriaceae bacterium]|nr:fibronectin type III domain-containing protein [Propionibacteriaceae bacterium]
DQLAQVTWNAPTPDDPSITGYTITIAPADTPAVTVDPTARTATVTGLTNRTAYTFTVATTNPDGTSPPSDPSAPVTPGPPAATTLTLAASPTSILHGGTIQLSGRLQQTTTAEGIAGATLALERRPKGGTSWTALATMTTTSDGTLDPTQAVTPQAHTDYRLRHPATPFYAASTSPTVTVLVGVRLTARSNRTSMALGRTATITGQVVPAHSGQRIRLQHKQGRTWRAVQAKPCRRPAATASPCGPEPLGPAGGGSPRPATPTTSAPSAAPSDSSSTEARSPASTPTPPATTVATSTASTPWSVIPALPPSTWPVGNWMPGIAANGSPWPAIRSRRAPRCGSTPAAGRPGQATCFSDQVGRSGTTMATPPPSSTPTTSP